jgi:hypothetical protein
MYAFAHFGPKVGSLSKARLRPDSVGKATVMLDVRQHSPLLPSRLGYIVRKRYRHMQHG